MLVAAINLYSFHFSISLLKTLCHNCAEANLRVLNNNSKLLSVSKKYHSRNMCTSFAEEKEMYLKMAVDEKRPHYKAKKYTATEEIKTWAEEFFKKNKQALQKGSTDRPTDIGTFAVSEQLNRKVSIWSGDITTLEVDAIVNAANSNLLGGGGVDGAIHRAAGPLLKEECRTFKGCETGKAVITGGYKLPAKYVIHTVGPRGEKPDLLQSCYNESLNLLTQNNLRTIAFPCISTGVYGYPQEPAAIVALKTVHKYLEEKPDLVDRVIFCLFLETDITIYKNLLQFIFPAE